MAERSPTKIFPRLRGQRWCIPTQRACRARRPRFTPGEESDGFRAKNGASAVEHRIREACKVLGRRKKSGMSSHTAQHAGIFILYFTLNHAITEVAAGSCLALVSRQRNLRM